jgi:hypothetical protein
MPGIKFGSWPRYNLDAGIRDMLGSDLQKLENYNKNIVVHIKLDNLSQTQHS